MLSLPVVFYFIYSLIHIYPLSIQRKDCQLQAVLGFCDTDSAMLELHQEDFLHRDEIAYLRDVKLEKTRAEFLRSRYLVKKALETYSLNESATDIQIGRGIFQQPLLLTKFHYQLDLSISHHHSVASCLIFPQQHPMGIDIEKCSTTIGSLIQDEVTDYEKKLYCINNETEDSFFTRLWTIKEALSKVLKTGMMIPFQMLETESIDYTGNVAISYYKQFTQYKAISFQRNDSVCTIVLPRASSLTLPPQFTY